MSTSTTMQGLTTGLCSDHAHSSVTPPAFLSSNYFYDTFGERPTFDYGRGGNPTRALLADALTTLEGGTGAVVTSSGMSAIMLVLQAFVPIGGHVIAPHDCYGGTWRILDTWAAAGRLTVDWVNETDLDALRTALGSPTDLLLVETPSNPLLRITDIAAAAELAHSSTGDRTVVAVDNTFCSPILQQPLSLGADLVIASDTKFLNGHSDVIGGSVVAAAEEDVDLMAFHANMMGVTASPLDAWLTLRGLRTLKVRMQAHCLNAARMVEILSSHKAVTAVHWPGLPDHPGHDLAARQQKDFGSLLSFELAGGLPAVKAFMTGLEGFILAESLGGVESLVCHPATMTHAAMSQEARDAAGVNDAMIRMSPGIDPVEDLAACLTEALDRAAAV
ncbi:PLP-dependent aspartate aminotransferase family protein [Cutibacterium sp.]|uniref:trans-sulfuration enzyme family protein n=1 Tax=Cutibacterium sp. TaxID=1912221 RepID=UPI0026DB0517|nr:PLP-dependent transferase [Cutibacterium sp.]MDO4412855.1 PLP-dependent transferase [Cutibacterium sp.]